MVCKDLREAVDCTVQTFARDYALELTSDTQDGMYTSAAARRWAAGFRKLGLQLNDQGPPAEGLHAFVSSHCSSLESISMASSDPHSSLHSLCELAVAASSARRFQYTGFLPTHFPARLSALTATAALDTLRPGAVERLLQHLLLCPSSQSAKLILGHCHELNLRCKELLGCADPGPDFHLTVEIIMSPIARLELSGQVQAHSRGQSDESWRDRQAGAGLVGSDQATG